MCGHYSHAIWLVKMLNCLLQPPATNWLTSSLALTSCPFCPLMSEQRPVQPGTLSSHTTNSSWHYPDPLPKYRNNLNTSNARPLGHKLNALTLSNPPPHVPGNWGRDDGVHWLAHYCLLFASACILIYA